MGFLALNGAWAQRTPDAGQLQQEIDRRLRDRPADGPVAGPLGRPAPPAGASSAGPSSANSPQAGSSRSDGPGVILRRIDFVGNTQVNDAALAAVVAPYLGRPLKFSDLQKAAAEVAQRYRELGWIVRTALAPQDLGDGVLKIEVIEARFGSARIEHDTATGPIRVEVQRLIHAVGVGLKRHEVVSTEALDHTLRRLQEWPGIRVQGNLAPGAEDGSTDLVLQTRNRAAIEGTYGIDNQGSRSTGSVRTVFSAAWASPTGAADRLSVQAMGSAGNRYLRGAYQRPIGAAGLMGGINASALAYRLTDPAMASLQAQGESRTAGLELTYPWLRRADANVSFSALLDSKWLLNRAVGMVVSDYRIDTLQLSGSGYRSDDWSGGGLTVLSLAATVGRAVLEGSPNEQADLEGPNVAGEFLKLRGALSRQQQVSERWTVSAAFSGQVANRNLDSSERFQIGGSSGVRAYSGSEGSGRRGYLLNVEAAWAAMPGLTMTGFLDRAQVWGDRPTGAWMPTGPTRIILEGGGLSAAWAAGAGASGKLVWARRIGRNPNPTASGLDQDGTLTLNRVWLEVSGSF